MPKRTRDFKAEYARRKAKGLKEGLSTSQIRGHNKPDELSVTDIRKARSGDKKHFLLRKVYDNGDPEAIKLYNQAKGEHFKGRRKPGEEPTAKDELFDFLAEEDDEDFANYAGETRPVDEDERERPVVVAVSIKSYEHLLGLDEPEVHDIAIENKWTFVSRDGDATEFSKTYRIGKGRTLTLDFSE